MIQYQLLESNIFERINWSTTLNEYSTEKFRTESEKPHTSSAPQKFPTINKKIQQMNH